MASCITTELVNGAPIFALIRVRVEGVANRDGNLRETASRTNQERLTRTVPHCTEYHWAPVHAAGLRYRMGTWMRWNQRGHRAELT